MVGNHGKSVYCKLKLPGSDKISAFAVVKKAFFFTQIIELNGLLNSRILVQRLRGQHLKVRSNGQYTLPWRVYGSEYL